MKLPSEDLEFLREFAHKRKTQEKDCCADPVFWMIQDEHNVYRVDGPFIEFYIDGELFYSTYNNFDSDGLKEFKEYCIDNNLVGKYDLEEFKAIEDNDDLYDYIDSCYDLNISIARFDREYFLSYNSGPFLTKEAAKIHLKENSHHYSKNARTYGMVGWRNPEFEKLMEIIEKFDDSPIKSEN